MRFRVSEAEKIIEDARTELRLPCEQATPTIQRPARETEFLHETAPLEERKEKVRIACRKAGQRLTQTQSTLKRLRVKKNKSNVLELGNKLRAARDQIETFRKEMKSEKFPYREASGRIRLLTMPEKKGRYLKAADKFRAAVKAGRMTRGEAGERLRVMREDLLGSRSRTDSTRTD